MRKIKRALTGILAATMVMASVVTVGATGPSGGGTNPGTEGTVPGDGGTSSGDTSSSDSSSSAASVSEAEASVAAANAAISVAGSSVRTTIAGAYAAKSVAGCAVVTPLANIRTALGLSAGQTPYIIIYDTDYNKSNLAMASVNAAAEALGANVVTALNIELGAKQNGKFVTLSNGSIGMTAGIPNADATKTYSVVCVQPGGVVTILEDQDLSPKTVTFEVQAGLGTYAIVVK